MSRLKKCGKRGNVGSMLLGRVYSDGFQPHMILRVSHHFEASRLRFSFCCQRFMRTYPIPDPLDSCMHVWYPTLRSCRERIGNLFLLWVNRFWALWIEDGHAPLDLLSLQGLVSLEPPDPLGLSPASRVTKRQST